MILPRPIIESIDINEYIDFIADNFLCGDIVTLCNDSKNYIFNYIGIDSVKMKNGKIGILKFYANVTKDIGLINTNNDNYRLSPLVWLRSGIDGTTNLDRLCKALAMNGELLPRDTVNGNKLKTILKESSDNILPIIDNDENVFAIVELIDYGLTKYGTYLDELADKSGVKIKKREGVISD